MRSRWVAPVLWAILIELLTSWPNPPAMELPAGSDKVAHLCLYAVFAFLVARAARSGRLPWRVVGVVSIALFAWAAADEWHQLFIPSRSAELADWFADALGVAVGLAARGAWASRLAMSAA